MGLRVRGLRPGRPAAVHISANRCFRALPRYYVCRVIRYSTAIRTDLFVFLRAYAQHQPGVVPTVGGVYTKPDGPRNTCILCGVVVAVIVLVCRPSSSLDVVVGVVVVVVVYWRLSST